MGRGEWEVPPLGPRGDSHRHGPKQRGKSQPVGEAVGEDPSVIQLEPDAPEEVDPDTCNHTTLMKTAEGYQCTNCGTYPE